MDSHARGSRWLSDLVARTLFAIALLLLAAASARPLLPPASVPADTPRACSKRNPRYTMTWSFSFVALDVPALLPQIMQPGTDGAWAPVLTMGLILGVLVPQITFIMRSRL
jgi:hypothetical protein